MAISHVNATPASARDGFYVAARGGITGYNLNDEEDSAADDARVDFDDVDMLSGALGYRVSYFRFEAEYTYRDNVDNDYKDPGFSGKSRSTFESDSFMANAYIDFLPNYWISPYVSGGLGLSRLEMTNEDTGGDFQKWDSDSFTWSAGAGATIRLNKCLNLDAGYRYLDMGSLAKATANSHEYYGGVRFTF